MSDLSKPILLGGMAAMVFYTVVCLITSIVFLTFYFSVRFSQAYQANNENPLLSKFEMQRSAQFVTSTPSSSSDLLVEHPNEPIPSPSAAESLQEKSSDTSTEAPFAESLLTLTSQAPIPTASPSLTLTASPTFTNTPLPTRTATSTPDFLLTAVKATALAQIPTRPVLPTSTQPPSIPADWDKALQKLADEKLIPSKKGSYYKIPDYEDSWNQTDWHRWTYLDKSPANFVIKAKTSWDTTAVAGMTANSGCGFVFRENGTENYYLMYLGINGRVYLYRMKDGAMKYLGNSIYYPIQSPSGSAEIMLVVNDIRFTFFINEDNVYDIMDGYFLSGKIGLTVMSGSAAGFGTRCKMEDIVLWAIE